MGEEERKHVQEQSQRRLRDRDTGVESIIQDIQADLGDLNYPVSSEELAQRYGDQTIDLPNETESLGSAFDRMDDTFEDERSAYSALAIELGLESSEDTRHTPVDPQPAGERGEAAGEPIDDRATTDENHEASDRNP